VKAQTAVAAETTNAANRGYHQPEVHDLGKLEQVQGGFIGVNREPEPGASGWYFIRP
jgi:hypothetical protein